MVLRFLAFAVMGKVAMYAIRIFPLTEIVSSKSRFFAKLVECDFCLGCWVFSILNMLSFHITVYDEFYSTIIGEIVTGIFVSFLVSLVSEGWKSKFSVIYIDGRG